MEKLISKIKGRGSVEDPPNRFEKLVTRDIDVLKELADYQAAVVILSITTLNPDLVRVMEPRTSQPDLRLRVFQLWY